MKVIYISFRITILGSRRGQVEVDPYSQIHRKGIRLIGAHETAQTLDLAPQRWSQARNLRLLTDLLAAGKLNSLNLISQLSCGQADVIVKWKS